MNKQTISISAAHGSMSLPRAPSSVVGPDGQPLCGRYAGLAEIFDWNKLAPPLRRGPLWRRLHHKRWHFVALTTDELLCVAAVVDVGWGTNAFGYAFDRSARKVVETFSLMGLPGMGAQVGANARAPSSLRMLGSHVEIGPAGDGGWKLSLRARRFRIEAEYGGAAETLLAIGPVLGGAAHATQKSTGLPLTGFAEADGRRFALDGGMASFDYSNGLLGRSTAWRWVSMHGPAVGLNLQQGYFGTAENALWLDGQVSPLGEALLEAEPGDRAWRVRTADGQVDLCFTPEGARIENMQLVLASSRLKQQIGVFDGVVRASPGSKPRAVAGLVGMLEQHSARW